MKASLLFVAGLAFAISSIASANARDTRIIEKPTTTTEWRSTDAWPPKWANFEACVAAGHKWAWDQNSISLWCGAQPYGAAYNRVSGSLR